jgi:hypothetical protein
MTDRWLYGIDGGGGGPVMGDEWGPVPPPGEDLTYGLREPVPQQTMRGWLQRVVGGPEELERLVGDPLPVDEPLHPDALAGPVPPGWVRSIDAVLMASGPPPLAAAELPTVYRRLLAASARARLLERWRSAEPARVAAGIIHCAAKANGLVGGAAVFRVRDYLAGVPVQSYQDRSRALAITLGGDAWCHGQRPPGVPDVYVLGDTAFLVSRFRLDLMSLRDVLLKTEAARAAATAG